MHSQIIRGVPRAFAAANVALLLMASHAGADERATAKLEEFHSGFIERYPEVAHISSDALQEMPPKDVVVFDVRKSSEFDVSRIEGAIRVSGEKIDVTRQLSLSDTEGDATELNIALKDDDGEGYVLDLTRISSSFQCPASV